MQARFTEVQWLDVHQEIPLPQLAELSGLSPAELRALADFGVFQPLDPAAAELHYRADYIVLARTACRLRDDLELNIEGLAMVLKLLERMRSLETELQDVKARLPGHIGQG